MARKKKIKTTPSGYTPPPPNAEQKRLRKKDSSIVPAPPYLVASKFLDVSCSLPLVSRACPNEEDGGWRSVFPWREMVEFPEGKLSHSFDGYFPEGELEEDVTFDEYMANVNANAASNKSNKAVGKRSSNNIVGDNSSSSSSSISTTLNNYYNFAFHTNNTTLCDLTHPLALWVLFALLIVVRILKKIFMPKFSALGQRLGSAAHGPEWESENADRIVKFGEYVYRLCYHSAVSIYGLWYFWDKEWWDNAKGGTKNLWIGHPNQTIEPGMTWYYLVQSAYNVDALLSLIELSFTVELVNPFAYSSALDILKKEHVVDNEELRKQQVFQLMAKSRRSTLLWTPIFQIKWSPTVRGDFREMMAHHLVTYALIFLSSYYRLTRIGSMVFFVHDLSDVPVDLSKLANFVKWKITTIVCFVSMVLLWIVTRLTILPFVICKSVVFESHEYLVVRGPHDPALHDMIYPFFYALLGALVCLHITWFMILLRIGWTLVSKGERHDYSEHKSGEKQKSS